MVCMYCGGKTEIINSRPQKRTNTVWRRRQCDDCQAVFTTLEAADLYKSLLVQHANGLQPFSRDKLLLSIHDALKHRKTATSDATALTETVLHKLLLLVADASLKREQIVMTTQKTLNNFDKAAAVHYQAYHT